MERKRSQDYLTVGFVPTFDLEVEILWGVSNKLRNQ